MSREAIREMNEALDRYKAGSPAIQNILERHDVSPASADGEMSLLHHAARHGTRKTVDWLLRQPGCRRNARDAAGLTPLDYAVAGNCLDIVAFLLTDPHNDTGEPLQYRNMVPRPCLRTTAQIARDAEAADSAELLREHERTRMREALRAADPQLGLADPRGRTVLHYAVMQQEWEEAQRLMKAGADPHQTDEHGESPLWRAVKQGGRAGLDLFYGAGADVVFERNDEAQCLAYLAAELGRVDILERLREIYAAAPEAKAGLSFSARLNAQDDKGRAVAHAAAMCDSAERAEKTARWLLAAGAEPLIATTDVHEDTPVSLALECGNPGAAEAFLGAIPDKDLEYVWQRYLALVTGPLLNRTRGQGQAIAERLLKAYRSFTPTPQGRDVLQGYCGMAERRIAECRDDGTERNDAEAVHRLIRKTLDEHPPVAGSARQAEPEAPSASAGM